MFYVYYLKNSIDNNIIYVGKGKNDRMYYHIKNLKNHYNKKLSNKINSILNKNGKILYEIVFSTTSEQEALNKEIELISEIGLKNLCNLTHGGDGGDTYTNNPNIDLIKEKISKSLKESVKFKKIIKSDVHRQNLSNSLKKSEKRMKIQSSDEYKKKMKKSIKNSEKCKDWYRLLKESGMHKGKNNPNYGNKWSDEQKEKLSKLKKKYFKTHDGTRKGVVLDEKIKQKISESHKGKKLSDDIKNKISETVKIKKPWLNQTVYINRYLIKNIKTNVEYQLYGRDGIFKYFKEINGHVKGIYKIFKKQEYYDYIIIDIVKINKKSVIPIYDEEKAKKSVEISGKIEK